MTDAPWQFLHHIQTDQAQSFSPRSFPPSFFPSSEKENSATSSISSGRRSSEWVDISCSNFSFYSQSHDIPNLLQEARADLQDGIAVLIVVVVELLHHSLERNRILKSDFENIPTRFSFSRLFIIPSTWFSKSSLSEALHFFRAFPLFYIEKNGKSILFPAGLERHISGLFYQWTPQHLPPVLHSAGSQ